MSIRLVADLRSFCVPRVASRKLPLSGFFVSTLVLGASLLSAGAAQADPAPLGPASDYNVFILGTDNESNTDSEGRVAVGGDANLSSYHVAGNLPTNTTNALVVGGMSISRMVL